MEMPLVRYTDKSLNGEAIMDAVADRRAQYIRANPGLQSASASKRKQKSKRAHKKKIARKKAKVSICVVF